jgi:hypothetical protein
MSEYTPTAGNQEALLFLVSGMPTDPTLVQLSATRAAVKLPVNPLVIQ